jgi:hypothetical protein
MSKILLEFIACVCEPVSPTWSVPGSAEGAAAMSSGRVASLFWCRRTSYDAARHETPRRTP